MELQSILVSYISYDRNIHHQNSQAIVIEETLFL